MLLAYLTLLPFIIPAEKSPTGLVKIGPVISEIWVLTDNTHTDNYTEAPLLFNCWPNSCY